MNSLNINGYKMLSVKEEHVRLVMKISFKKIKKRFCSHSPNPVFMTGPYKLYNKYNNLLRERMYVYIRSQSK